MKKGYWMVSVDVTDPENYPQYVAANRVAFEKYGARFLARGGRNEIVEGAAGARNVIIEFDSFEQALACYNSAEYQQALKLRLAAATATLVIVEGV
jgi:uncharacterized protein (DUF1330 family)